MAARLNPAIRDRLQVVTNLNEKSLREKISRMLAGNPDLTPNAVGQIILNMKNKKWSVRRYLDADDKKALSRYLESHRTPAIAATVRSPARPRVVRTKKNALDAFKYYPPRGPIAERYIWEIERAYAAECYTCVFILTRKLVENLIIDIMESKFQGEDYLVYSDKGRTHQFSRILDNLKKRIAAFSPKGQQAVERLLQLVSDFKDDADAKTHRWFHAVTDPGEMNKWQLPILMEAILTLEKEVKLR